MADWIRGADHRVVATGTGGAARQALRWLTVGLVAALLLGSVPLQQWTEGLGDAPWALRLNNGAILWANATARVGLNQPYAALRQAVRRAEGQPGG